MYTKDFNSLLNLLDVSQQSGTLLVEIPGKGWQAEMQLENGKPLSCVLVAIADGRVLLQGMQAIQWLSGIGELQWRLEEGRLPTSGAPLARPSNAIPYADRQTGKVDPGYSSQTSQNGSLHIFPRRLNRHGVVDSSWARDMRRVFALIDGTRSLEEIARLLHKSSEEVLSILQELASQGFIQM